MCVKDNADAVYASVNVRVAVSGDVVVDVYDFVVAWGSGGVYYGGDSIAEACAGSSVNVVCYEDNDTGSTGSGDSKVVV